MTSVKRYHIFGNAMEMAKKSTICSHNTCTITKTCSQGLSVCMPSCPKRHHVHSNVTLSNMTPCQSHQLSCPKWHVYNKLHGLKWCCVNDMPHHPKSCHVNDAAHCPKRYVNDACPNWSSVTGKEPTHQHTWKVTVLGWTMPTSLGTCPDGADLAGVSITPTHGTMINLAKILQHH